MHLEKLQLTRVRNLTEVHLECCSEINIIAGKNAAGKTAILEGIHLLAKVCSFRTPRTRDIIQHGQDNLVIHARAKNAENTGITTGLEKHRQQTVVKYNGERVRRRSEQARNLPLITLTTESYRLVYGAPKERRHWLDWSLFHVEPHYMALWHDYHDALRHRNTLLRQKVHNDEYLPWEKQLAEKGARIRALRDQYLQNLQRQLHTQKDSVLDPVRISLQSKPEDEDALLNRYRQRENDIFAGHTQTGAHREDVLFQANGKDAGKTYSRGEGKWFVSHLLLAQARDYQSRRQNKPLLLIDDIAAELDEEHKESMLATIAAQQMQVFLTTTHADLLPVRHTRKRVFHVEQGRIVKVVE